MARKHKESTVLEFTVNSHHVIFECGICGEYHPWNFDADCRDDANRYATPEDYSERNKLTLEQYESIEVRSMDERVEADGAA